jgi:hypothetical protein
MTVRVGDGEREGWAEGESGMGCCSEVALYIPMEGSGAESPLVVGEY